jgi:hypothetical protein
VTSYIVLQEVEAKGVLEPLDAGVDAPAFTKAKGWMPVGPPVESASAEAAIRKAVDGDKGGTYVAVPLRSWSPIVVKVETTRVLKLAGVGA